MMAATCKDGYGNVVERLEFADFASADKWWREVYAPSLADCNVRKDVKPSDKRIWTIVM